MSFVCLEMQRYKIIFFFLIELNILSVVAVLHGWGGDYLVKSQINFTE